MMSNIDLNVICWSASECTSHAKQGNSDNPIKIYAMRELRKIIGDAVPHRRNRATGAAVHFGGQGRQLMLRSTMWGSIVKLLT